MADFARHDATLFLALCQGGGGPYDLVGLIGVYDGINRSVLSSVEMEEALNRLAATGLVLWQRAGFVVPASVRTEFESFRRRRRTDRFETAEEFVRSRSGDRVDIRPIRIDSVAYEAAYDRHAVAVREG